ncbi:MAG: HAD family hydrolase [Treponema sp.]|nr:HAD family hydrolase [Treponema sp.]
MKTFNLPENINAIIFDIDSTLYTSSKYAFEQVDCQVREFARLKGISADDARKMVADYRKKYAETHNGSKVSLGNTLLSFGIPIEQSVEWRKQLLEPKDFLSYDEKLVLQLKQLSSKYKLICVTNNPVLPARKTLDAIGISEFFKDIVGLDTCYKSKPAKEPFEKALELLGCKAEECVAVGDRYDLDIALPLEMGMGGVLVNGVEDVYNLHDTLNK